MLKTICSYCNRVIKEFEKEPSDELRISHGICVDCFEPLMEEMGTPLRDYLDHFEFPVLLVDADSCLQMANLKAKELLGHQIEELDDRRMGNVIECDALWDKEGCGNTIHCRTCTLRNSITHTYDTGIPLSRVPAYADVGNLTKKKNVRFFISTEKIGDKVLLQIHEL